MKRLACSTLVVALLTSTGCSWIQERRFVSGVKNKPAPDFQLSTPDGRQVRLGDLRGKPVLLAFWAHG